MSLEILSLKRSHGISRRVQESLKGVKVILRKIEGCFKEFLKVCRGSFKSVSWMFQVCFN